jgi:septum site-determining protein MinD
MVQANDMMSVEDVQEILAVQLLGIVPDDEKVIVSTNKGEPLVLSEIPSLAATAFDNIVRRLEGERVPLMDLTPQNEGFFSRLLSKFSKKKL